MSYIMDEQIMSSSQICRNILWLPVSVYSCVFVCLCPVMGAAAASESTSTGSAGLTQSSTAEEQAQTPSPHCPPPTCKSAAVYLIRLSALTFLSWPFPPAADNCSLGPNNKATQDILVAKRRHVNRNIGSSARCVITCACSILLCCHLLALWYNCSLLLPFCTLSVSNFLKTLFPCM